MAAFHATLQRRIGRLSFCTLAMVGMAGDPSSLVPAPRKEQGAIERQDLLLCRVRESKGPVDVVFVGDSITQGWEGPGKEAWDTVRASMVAAPITMLNLGNSGDRTEHVLWRLQQAPLTPLAPKAIVLLIGTNNLGHGTSNAAETLAGTRAVLKLLHEQCPQARIVAMATFPRGERLNPMRGDILQVNQAIAADHGAEVAVLDIGTRFVQPEGDIRKDLMPDALHLSPAGYRIWADAVAEALRPVLSAPAPVAPNAAPAASR